MKAMLRRTAAVAVSAILALPAAGWARDRSHDAKADQKLREELSLAFGGRARNVILFLGDGMGDSEITSARNYHVGANGRLTMDTLPFTGEYTTYALQESNPTLPEYVTDSAASGTGWATGHKTSNGRISTAAQTNQSWPTILELASAAGYKTGNVSTAEITDATPAVLGAHINERGCQGPANMANCTSFKKLNGGPGSIAEQLVDHGIDVILGGGKQRFDQTIDGGTYNGQTVLQSAAAQGYTFVGNAADLGSFSGSGRLLGLFTSGNMTTEWSGTVASPYPGSGPQRCAENNRPAVEPSLADMTRKAIDLLTQDQKPGRSPKQGFFLQVEGASIDKQDHAAAPCQQIGETIAFDEAIKAGLEFAAKNPDTLIVITADHGHTSQIIEGIGATEGAAHPGSFSVLQTADGANMTINYATAPFGSSQQHTGTEVRIAAKGPNGHKVLGIINQTDLFHIMAEALGLE